MPNLAFTSLCSLPIDHIWDFHGFAPYHLIMHRPLASSDRRPSTRPFLAILPSLSDQTLRSES